MKTYDRLGLIILDGWGLNSDPQVSAIEAAHTPYMDYLLAHYPTSTLVTYGEDVGLPDGQMGNSEVGHINIGAGRVVYQELARINKSIRERELHTMPALLKALTDTQKRGSALHLMGLVSDGGVHSHINHLKALVDIALSQNIQRIFIHVFTDGRDVDPKSGAQFIADLQQYIQGTRVVIASIVGRYFAMDRDKRWERVQKAYNLLVNGIGTPFNDPVQALQNSYAQGITDEFIEPHIYTGTQGTIQPNDTVISFNFRTDRPREITQVLSQTDMPEWNMHKLPLQYLTMTRYDDTYQGITILFEKDNLQNTLGEVIANNQRTQIRIAETEKYPHVTYFFSGGRENAFSGEERIMIPSPKVATYDLQPEMSAPQVADAIVHALYQSKPDFFCLNFANTDMVGHTGIFKAAVKATQTVDQCLKTVADTALSQGYALLIIADHGNSDVMINPDGSPNTAHTTNPVPCILVTPDAYQPNLLNGKLADLAPTILHLMGIPTPPEMNGNNLIQHA